jgi:hypothetical protein
MMRTKMCAVVLLSATVLLAQAPGTPRGNDRANRKMDDMLNSGTGARALPSMPLTGPTTNAATTRPGVSPGSPATAVLREGTLVVDRVGRLTRSPDGAQVEFVFDADGQRMGDPPVVILPNLKLMAMEQAAAGVNRDLRFRITGMVTEYRSRNYVLLDKVVVMPEAGARF